MTTLVWDRAGERRYETGVDRGVLYFPGENAVVWNGLISINENVSREVKPYYIDGIKFLDHHVPGSYSGKLSAFTYPDKMDEFIGSEEFAPGVFIHDQRSSKMFNLSYRTRLGTNLEGINAYRIHILYNLLAVLSDTTSTAMGDSIVPQTFEWSFYGTPTSAGGRRPTSHISLDSRRMNLTTLATLEDMLYGSASSDPSLPSLVDILNLISA